MEETAIIDSWKNLANAVLRQALKDAKQQSRSGLEAELEMFSQGRNIEICCGLAGIDVDRYRKALAGTYRQGVERVKLRRIRNEVLKEALKEER